MIPIELIRVKVINNIKSLRLSKYSSALFFFLIFTLKKVENIAPHELDIISNDINHKPLFFNVNSFEKINGLMIKNNHDNAKKELGDCQLLVALTDTTKETARKNTGKYINV